MSETKDLRERLAQRLAKTVVNAIPALPGSMAWFRAVIDWHKDELRRAQQPAAPSPELAEAGKLLEAAGKRPMTGSWLCLNPEFARIIAAELDRRAAETERLKARLVSGGTQAFHLHADRCDEIAALRAENARLRDGLEAMANHDTGCAKNCEPYMVQHARRVLADAAKPDGGKEST